MKNLLFSFSLIVFLLCITTFIYLNYSVLLNESRNEFIVKTLKKFSNNEQSDNNDNFIFPKMEIRNKDYIGTINFLSGNLILPIKSSCDRSFFQIQSTCHYGSNNFVILGTNLQNSIYNYALYDIDDYIILSNCLGSNFKYQIVDVKRGTSLDKLLEFNYELMIVVKDYYAMEYVVFYCKGIK